MSVCLAGISDLSPDPKQRSKNLGLWAVTLGISAIVSMTLGGFLIDLNSSATCALPFWIAAILTALSYISVFAWLDETHRPKGKAQFKLSKSFKEIRDAIRMPSLRLYLFVVLFWTLGWGLPMQWYAPIGLEQYHSDPKTIAYYMAILCFFWAVGGGVLNRILIKWFPSISLSLFSMLVVGLVLPFMPLAATLPTFSLFYWSIALIAPLAMTNNITLVSTSAPEEAQGRAMGFTQSFQSLGWLIYPFLGGLLAESNMNFIFYSSAVFYAVGFLLLMIQRCSKKRIA